MGLAFADQAVGRRGPGRNRGRGARRAGDAREREDEGGRHAARARRHGRLPSVATNSGSSAPRFTVMRTACPGFRERSAKV